MGFTTNPDGTRSFTVPPIIGTLKLNNGRVATFYETERGSYERALESGATPVDPPPADTTVVNGKEVATTTNVPPPADIVTTSESQATPQPATPPTQPGLKITNDDSGAAWAPTQKGVGAGTGQPGSGDSPQPTGTTTQIGVSASAAELNQLITTQPNQLDQYASYTYNIGWYLLSEAQYTAMVDAQKANVTGWQLLMQSGGAPIKGRSPAFSLDYYMDDLEIESVIPFGGTNRPNSLSKIRFKITEPNGITLLESLFSAVQSVYKKAQQSQANSSANTINYLRAHYCLVIEFFGYDSQGKLVAPIKGAFSTTGGYGQSAQIIKYYPFILEDIKFQVANRAIEYLVTGVAAPYAMNSNTDRGTIPFPFTMTGQTVEQLLTGSPVAGKTATNSNSAVRETKTAKGTVQVPVTPMPNQYNVPGWNSLSTDVQLRAQQSWFDTYGRQYNADGTQIGGK